jgi:predicted PurR-regulated permease PerM
METAPPLLSPAQRRIVSVAVTLLALVAAGALVVGTFMAFAQLVAFFSGVLWPLAAAGVLALILRPVVQWFEARLRLTRRPAVVLLYGIFVLLVGGAILLVAPPLVDQIVAFVAYVPELSHSAAAYAHAHFPHWIEIARRQLANPTVRQIADSVSKEGRSLLMQTVPSLRVFGGGLLGAFAFVTHLAIVPVYLFFFLLARGRPVGKLSDQLTFLPLAARDNVVFLLHEFVSIVESFFRGQILIGLIMGVLLATGFSLIGLKFGLFIGLAAGLLNLVPYLGTIIGLAVAVPIAFLQPNGGWPLVGLVLLVKLIVQAIEGWVLTPKIMGDRTGLHPVTIIVAIFFWGTAFGGILGMLLAIPLTAFVVTAWRLFRQQYLHDGRKIRSEK